MAVSRDNTGTARLLSPHFVPLEAFLYAAQSHLVPSLPVSRSRSGDDIDPRGSLGCAKYVTEVPSVQNVPETTEALP